MAQQATIEVNKDAWTLLTDSDITAAAFQITGANAVRILGVVGASQPLLTSEDGFIYEVRQGESTLRTLLDIYPGIAATRLYGKSIGGGSKVFISHA